MKQQMGWLFLTAAIPMLLLSAAPNSGEIGKGKDVFERRCAGCHDLDQVRSGPKLRRVFGRPAASEAGFPYSDSLKASHLTWNEVSLDRWLADPEALIPDNDMAFRVSDSGERAAIIAYLKSLAK